MKSFGLYINELWHAFAFKITPTINLDAKRRFAMAFYWAAKQKRLQRNEATSSDFLKRFTDFV